MSFPYIIQGKNIVVVIGNNSHTINHNHIAYEKLLAAIKAGDWDTVKNIIEPQRVVLQYGSGNLSIQGDRLFWRDVEMHNTLADRVVRMYQDGFSIEPMVNFMENLMQNPSHRAVTELYGFLERGQMPITPDGCFLAFKRVRPDFKDCHTGTIDNSVGQIVTMERNQVDDNYEHTCSAGLHFCSQEYLDHFGSSEAPVMILKINPRDVVSIPCDYHNSKGRCCRYEVIGQLGVDPAAAFPSPVQETASTASDTPAV
jgi:hypothetical protein